MSSQEGRRCLSAAQRDMLDTLSLTGELPVPVGWRALRSLASLERQGHVRLHHNERGQVVRIEAASDAPKIAKRTSATSADEALAKRNGLTLEELYEARKFAESI